MDELRRRDVSKAIGDQSVHLSEIIYNGQRFRSSLEARWAVFYDSLCISYSYTPIVCDTGVGTLLPDFYLPEQRCFIEIEHNKPTDDVLKRAALLSAQAHTDIFVFYGGIPSPQDVLSREGAIAVIGRTRDEGRRSNEFETDFYWTQCPKCLLPGITKKGHAEDLPCGCVRHLYDGLWWASAYNIVDAAELQRFKHRLSRRYASSMLRDAYQNARLAQFDADGRDIRTLGEEREIMCIPSTQTGNGW